MHSRFLLGVVVAAATMLLSNQAIRAQDSAPKIEVGLQFTALHLTDFQEGPVGIGGRIIYNFTNNFALDAEASHFPENPSGNFGETQGLFGMRAGKRMDTIGTFVKARPGFIQFDGGYFDKRLDKKRFFALDIGGVIEYYPSSRIVLRFDIGDTIIAYQGATYIGSPTPAPLGTSHNLQAGFGFGIRF